MPSSTDTKISSIDSRSSCDSYESIPLTEDSFSLESEDSQILQSTKDPLEENKNIKTSKRKSYSMKDGATRSRTLYEHRRKNENIENERVKEIKELRKTFEKNNEIQEKRNNLLENFLKEFKASKDNQK